MEEEERLRTKEREKELIEKYYGKKQGSKRVPHKVMHASIAVLTANELDDDAIITLLEENPTYSRDPKLLLRARSKNAGEHQAHTPETQPPQSGKPKISFRIR